MPAKQTRPAHLPSASKDLGNQSAYSYFSTYKSLSLKKSINELRCIHDRKLTLIEMEGMLKDRSKPCDIRCDESIAQYLHRGIQALVTERNNLREDRNGLLKAGGHAL
ncbi:hypothetical protein [Pseudomonas alabamensis]|uniref:hypothetical protein n=1 Tax=Pseudomonas alabamensis TaxID=3064349 RepID=UPI0012D95B3D